LPSSSDVVVVGGRVVVVGSRVVVVVDDVEVVGVVVEGIVEINVPSPAEVPHDEITIADNRTESLRSELMGTTTPHAAGMVPVPAVSGR
jgi:hypothetical protein